MDPQPGQMTIWLVVPSGLSMGPELTALLVGAVSALSTAVVAAREMRGGEEGPPAKHHNDTPHGLVSAFCRGGRRG